MKIISAFEADACFELPAWDHAVKRGREHVPAQLPLMRASLETLVVHEDYLAELSDFIAKWKFETGYRYEPGSAMCEAGVLQARAHVDRACQPWRGIGRVPAEVIADAERKGRAVPKERLGDFAIPARELRVIQGGVINGVADGGHSTVGLLVHDAEGAVRAEIWEWQNGRFLPLTSALELGFLMRDNLD